MRANYDTEKCIEPPRDARARGEKYLERSNNYTKMVRREKIKGNSR